MRRRRKKAEVKASFVPPSGAALKACDEVIVPHEVDVSSAAMVRSGEAEWTSSVLLRLTGHYSNTSMQVDVAVMFSTEDAEAIGGSLIHCAREARLRVEG